MIVRVIPHRSPRPRSRRRWIGLAVALLALPIAAYAVAVALREPLPVSRVDAARQTLSRVQREVANPADPLLAVAVGRAEAMELELARARGALLDFHAADRVGALAVEVETLASDALERHQTEQSRAVAAAQARLLDLEGRLASFADSLPAFPADHRLRRHYLRGRLELDGARKALAAGEVAPAETGLDEARFHLAALTGQVDRLTARYSDPALRRQWQDWVDRTVAATERGGQAVIVEKASGRALLVRRGRAVAAFRVELGRNGLAGKVHSGDAATPEGRYRVVEKRENGRTKFHRALLLDYPNDDDRRAYERAVRRGQVPRGRGIGGLIEIHGEGGQGLNWTDGCIALTNPDMDRLYDAVATGTPVTIVGRARVRGADPGAPSRLTR